MGQWKLTAADQEKLKVALRRVHKRQTLLLLCLEAVEECLSVERRVSVESLARMLDVYPECIAALRKASPRFSKLIEEHNRLLSPPNCRRWVWKKFKKLPQFHQLPQLEKSPSIAAEQPHAKAFRMAARAIRENRAFNNFLDEFISSLDT